MERPELMSEGSNSPDIGETTPPSPMPTRAEETAERLRRVGAERERRIAGEVPRREDRPAMARRRDLEENPLRTEFAELAFTPQEAFEKLEELIRGIEDQGGGVKFPDDYAGEIYRGIYEGVTANPILRNGLISMLRARILYQDAQFAVAIGGIELFANQIGTLDSKDNNTILKIVGVAEALHIFSSEEGSRYFRFTDDQGNQKKDWLRRQKIKLIRGTTGYARREERNSSVIDRSYYIPTRGRFRELGNLIPDDQELDGLLVLTEAQTIEQVAESKFPGDKDRQGELIRLLYETNRAFALAEKASNIVGISGRYDGPKLEDGSYAHVDSVPLVFEGKRYDLVVPPEGEIMGKIRDRQPYLIAEAWDRAWRNYFRDNWNKIDVEASMKGGAPGNLKRIYYFPAFVARISNPNRGRAEFLRRYAHVGVQDLMRYTGRTDIEEMLREWDLGIRLSWVSRLKGGDKVRKMFTEDAPKFLDNSEAVNDLSLKSFGAIIDAMSYLPPEEQREYAAFLLSGVGIFMQEYNRKAFGKINVGAVVVDSMISNALSQGMVDKAGFDEAETRALGPLLIRKVKTHLSKIPILGALFGLITDILKFGIQLPGAK